MATLESETLKICSLDTLSHFHFNHCNSLFGHFSHFFASVDLNFGGPELNAGYEMMNDEDYSPTLYGWCQVLIKGKHASSASWNLIPLTISLSAIDSLRKQGK